VHWTARLAGLIAPTERLAQLRSSSTTFGENPFRALERHVNPAGLSSSGLVLVVAVPLWPRIARMGLSRLPGDIIVERENFRLYIPLANSLLISIVVSAAMWLLNRWLREADRAGPRCGQHGAVCNGR
jgi:hypothetical protein